MTKSARTKDKRTGWLGWLGQVVAWLVILSVGTVIILSVIAPRIGGGTPYTILTGSMMPSMPPGTLAVTRVVPIDEIGVGSVITYQLESGKPTVVTHRVVSTGFNGKGEHIFYTQGDANNAVDKMPVLPAQIQGRLWYKVPYLGYVNTLISGKGRDITMVAVVSFLLMYSAYMFSSAVRDRARKSRELAMQGVKS